MTRNVGATDRTLRTLFGVGVLSLVFFGPQTAWGYLGLIALLSAASGFCPLYKIIGVKTRPHPPSAGKRKAG